MLHPVLQFVLGLAALAVILAAGLHSWGVFIRGDHDRRIERAALGLPEIPRDKRKPAKPEPLPESIRALIEPWSSAAVRRHLEAECRALRKEGSPWDEIERMLAEQTPGDE